MPHCLNLSLLPECVWYVKFKHIFTLGRNFKQFQEQGKERCVAVTVLTGELAEAASSLCDFEKFYKTSSSHATHQAGCERFEGDREIIHQPLHLGLMACLQTGMFDCVLDAYRTPTYSFYVRVSAGSTVSGLTNGFSNPLVCWKFFQPRVLKPKPKMYLNTSTD